MDQMEKLTMTRTWRTLSNITLLLGSQSALNIGLLSVIMNVFVALKALSIPTIHW